jgi:hypothetical protein
VFEIVCNFGNIDSLSGIFIIKFLILILLCNKVLSLILLFQYFISINFVMTCCANKILTLVVTFDIC